MLSRTSQGYSKFSKAIMTSLMEKGGVKEEGKVSPLVFPREWV